MDASGVCERGHGSRDAFARLLGILTIIGLLGSTIGCGTLSSGRGWGQDAFSNVDRKTIARAAHDAFFDVQTLLPAVAAAVLGPSGLGESLSDWAAEETPMFGSQKTARNVSDHLLWFLGAETMGTLMATPSGLDAGTWWQAKARGLGVEFLAAGVSAGATIGLKAASDRRRPNDDDQHSFPSGHASSAFSLSTLSNRNLDSLELAPWLRTSLQVGNIVTASTIAWGRVEGHEHFPEDVLVGAALGHFLSAFIHDALIGLPASRRFRLLIWPTKSEAMVSIAFSF
jgi:membrane-associated phospholipid phosphatase